MSVRLYVDETHFVVGFIMPINSLLYRYFYVFISISSNRTSAGTNFAKGNARKYAVNNSHHQRSVLIRLGLDFAYLFFFLINHTG